MSFTVERTPTGYVVGDGPLMPRDPDDRPKTITTDPLTIHAFNDIFAKQRQAITETAHDSAPPQTSRMDAALWVAAIAVIASLAYALGRRSPW
jgi:hypothetical protein